MGSRVRREELLRPDSDEGGSISDGESTDLRAELAARLSSLISLDFQPLEEDVTGSQQAQDRVLPATDDRPEQPPAFEFRLFASSAGPVPKVLLTTAEDDVLAQAEGSVVSRRPVSFYLRGELTPREAAAIRFSAVSGAEVCRRAKERAWGLEMPWRVVEISQSPRGAAGKPISVPAPPPLQDGITAKKKRPGKKMRILLRTRERARKEKEAIELKQKMTKEEHLKEKKKRLNREKKLKRRKKEKEKKTADRANATADGSVQSADREGND